MTFTRQTSYKDLNGKLFLGSPYKELDFSKVNYDWIHLTNYFPYAVIYARKNNDDFIYIHQFNIKRQLKIFNARCTSDIQFLKDNFENYSEELIVKLQTKDWTEVDTKDLKKILIEKGHYDGFFDYEVINEHILSSYMNKIQPSLCLFDANNLCNHTVYEKRDFSRFKDYSEIRNAEYWRARKIIAQEFENDKTIDEAIDIAFDKTRMLSKYEVSNAYNVMIIDEWMQNKYKNNACI